MQANMDENNETQVHANQNNGRHLFYTDENNDNIIKTEREELLNMAEAANETFDNNYDDDEVAKLSKNTINDYERDEPQKFRTDANKFLFWTGTRIAVEAGNDGIYGRMRQNRFWGGKLDGLRELNLMGTRVLQGQHVSDAIAGKTYYTVRARIDEKFGMIPQDQDAWEAICRAFAEHASGTVFFVRGPGIAEPDIAGGKHKDGFWEKVERPSLMGNNAVDLIAELDFWEPSRIKSIIIKEKLTAEKATAYGLPQALIDRVGQNLYVKCGDDGFAFIPVDGNGEIINRAEANANGHEQHPAQENANGQVQADHEQAQPADAERINFADLAAQNNGGRRREAKRAANGVATAAELMC